VGRVATSRDLGGTIKSVSAIYMGMTAALTAGRPARELQFAVDPQFGDIGVEDFHLKDTLLSIPANNQCGYQDGR
jgi:hypothetical protein